MLNLIQVIILSVIQGIAEWLPISSSGHLALVQSIFGYENLSFDVFLHLASILAVIILLWKDIVKLIYPWSKNNFRYLFILLIAIIPAGLVGIFFRNYIEGVFANPQYVGILFIISGIIVYSTKFSKIKDKNIGFFDSIIIGIFQALAVFPGISRSGATISSGMFRGIKRNEAVKFSFIMAIPLVLGAGLFEAKDMVLSNIDPMLLIISFIITFVISLVSIKLLLKIINKEKFYLFGIYNISLGILVIMLKIFGKI